MTQALINPSIQAQYISSWTDTIPLVPVYSLYPNSGIVCQVEPDNQIFPVALPLEWISCPDNTISYEVYYDITNQTINPIVNINPPVTHQTTTTTTITTGVQSA
jgi:hypothetical protein